MYVAPSSANGGQRPDQAVLKAAEQGFQRFVLLLAPGVALLLVRADRTVVKASQTGKQHID